MMFSIVTPNRNRISRLREVLPSWQGIPEVSEIIVVDYGSDNRIRVSDFTGAEKLKVVRVNDTAAWRIGRAINVGVDLATAGNICKLDSDIRIAERDLFTGLDMSNAFYRGRHGSAVSNGQVIFRKTHWESIGGYNEWLRGYGFDDSDFYLRMKCNGCAERFINSGLVDIVHGDEDRISMGMWVETKYFRKQFHNPKKMIAFESAMNTYLSYLKKWTPECRQAYRVVSASDCGRELEVEYPPLPAEYHRLRRFSEYLALTRFYADEKIVAVLSSIMTDLIQEDGGL